MMVKGFTPGSLALLLLVLCLSRSAPAQELTPRAYWPTPHGSKFFILGYAYQSGDIVTDPSLPISGVDSKIHSGLIAYRQTISLFGRSSNFQFELPYVSGETTGLVLSESNRREVSGFGDLGALLSINLIGAPSLDLEGFRELRRNPRPILGVSVKIVAPTGEYDADQLINIGTNRWSVRARLGYTQPLYSKWLAEIAVGTWFFERNDEFLGTSRDQEPITAFDFSLIRRFTPGLWASLDLNYYLGGRTTIDGDKNANFQRNTRAGFTFVFPIKGRHAIKSSVSRGVTTDSGGDFFTFALSYLYLIG